MKATSAVILLVATTTLVLAAKDNYQMNAKKQMNHEPTDEEMTRERKERQANQGFLEYSNPDGLKVRWKLFMPPSAPGLYQLEELSASPQRQERANTKPVARAPYFEEQTRAATQQQSSETLAAPETPSVVQESSSGEDKFEYKPYHMAPSHIRDLIARMYERQQPYIDPTAYVYQELASFQHQDSFEESQPQEESETKEQKVQEVIYQPPQAPYYQQYQSKYFGSPSGKPGKLQKPRKEFQSQLITSDFQDEVASKPVQQQAKHQLPQMPSELQRLLELQAQTPYHIIADKILYKPKSIFVPRPIGDEDSETYKYRSKVYVVRDESRETEPDGEQAAESRQ